MRRLLLAAAVAATAFVAAPSADATCSLHYCIAEICGSEDHCGPIQRCYYWTDYPTCIYP